LLFSLCVSGFFLSFSFFPSPNSFVVFFVLHMYVCK
jgi:hypothetical protein